MVIIYKNIIPMLCMAFIMSVGIAQTETLAQTAEEIVNQQPAVAVLETPTDTMDMPAAKVTNVSVPMNYPTMRMTQDKSEMVKLEQEAASVIVGNPNHINVMLDTPDTLVVVPRVAGASHFTVMGKDGSILMQRHVIVGAPKEKYVRIRRSCNAASGNCEQMSTYFCPDTCHEVQPNTSTTRRR